MDISTQDQNYTRLFVLEGIIGELSKVISECNHFLKNCICDFCNPHLGFKQRKSLLLNLQKLQSFTPVNLAYGTGIYVVKLILQIKQALKNN